MVLPTRLHKGNHIRVIAPARSLSIIPDEVIRIAAQRLTDLGFRISYGTHVTEDDRFHSTSVEHRVTDLHEAFSDTTVDGILTVIGGYNSNQLLSSINYDLIKQNPKVFCGYSDITALQNAILTKTGLITYYGPHFSSFGEQRGFNYSQRYFELATMNDKPFTVKPSQKWSNDRWYRNQTDRTFIKSEGWWSLHAGHTQGTLIGGNLNTLNLLQGTEFMPDLNNVILGIEDDSDSSAEIFDRDLQSLLHLPNTTIRGILIGRFEKTSKIDRDTLTEIIESKTALKDIPILGNVDFGHTEPRITLPIGGTVEIIVSSNTCTLTILPH